MANLLQAQVEIENPDGTIRVKAKASAGRLMDARPLAGFYIRRRYDGDVFKISTWREFSPRWMEFVDAPPADWLEKLAARDGVQQAQMAQAEQPAPKSGEMPMSMRDVSRQQPRSSEDFDYSSGTIKRKPGRPRKNPESPHAA